MLGLDNNLRIAFATPLYLSTMALLFSSRTLSSSDTASTIGTDWFVTVCNQTSRCFFVKIKEFEQMTNLREQRIMNYSKVVLL